MRACVMTIVVFGGLALALPAMASPPAAAPPKVGPLATPIAPRAFCLTTDVQECLPSVPYSCYKIAKNLPSKYERENKYAECSPEWAKCMKDRCNWHPW